MIKQRRIKKILSLKSDCATNSHINPWPIKVCGYHRILRETTTGIVKNLSKTNRWLFLAVSMFNPSCHLFQKILHNRKKNNFSYFPIPTSNETGRKKSGHFGWRHKCMKQNRSARNWTLDKFRRLPKQTHIISSVRSYTAGNTRARFS